MCAMNEMPSGDVGPPDTRLDVAADQIDGFLHRASRRIERARLDRTRGFVADAGENTDRPEQTPA